MLHTRRVDLSNMYGKTAVLHNSFKNEEVVKINDQTLIDRINSFHHMFDGCDRLREVEFTDNLDLSKIIDTRCMFANCPNLERVIFPPNAFPSIYDCSYMFQNCPKLSEVIAPRLFIDPCINRISPNLHYFSKMTNRCQVSPSRLPGSLNFLIELDKHSAF